MFEKRLYKVYGTFENVQKNKKKRVRIYIEAYTKQGAKRKAYKHLTKELHHLVKGGYILTLDKDLPKIVRGFQ